MPAKEALKKAVEIEVDGKILARNALLPLIEKVMSAVAFAPVESVATISGI